MDIQYKSNPASINEEYKKIINKLSNGYDERKYIDKIVYRDDFLLIFSNEKPNALEYNKLISNIIIDSSNANIGFITYDTEDDNRKFAAEIREDFDDPISYISIYAQKLGIKHETEIDVRDIYDYVSKDIINRYDANMVIVSLIYILSEYNDDTINDDLIQLSKADVEYCKKEIMTDLESINL